MLRVGLTGGIGSGKSVVARLLQLLRVPVYPADARAKELMESDSHVRQALVERFGADLFASGRLDRQRLAARIFTDADALRAVNGIVHPAVRADFERWASALDSPYVVMEAAVMAENEGWRRFDRVVAVACPEQERVRRVMARDGASEAQVRDRIASQATEEQRLAIAHHVLNNDGAVLLIPQVLALHTELMRLAS
ncbi:MAG: dephospho-CoA kinase [Flavobacteriales bacterium]|jgi:dephospho-CoA kinase|nr:MAG: dephospho-CoA kinase [Flavobacteriales bacterium]